MTEAENDINPSPMREINTLLSEAWCWLLDDPNTDDEEQREYIYENVLAPGWHSYADGLTGGEILSKTIPHIHADGAKLWAARGIAAYYAEADMALSEGRLGHAWKIATEASYHVGVVRGMLSSSAHNPVRENAKKAADVRHAENREIAERIQAWFTENHHRYRSMDKAATDAIKLEPVAWRTARKHIGTAAKNLRSARKE